mmetsp:Transcript_28904/g.45330  ORF Transcript_28904/g.45330 Transcript_28904/m.45330 type:complete len:113 (+) Transcript_28904:237-575(+)
MTIDVQVGSTGASMGGVGCQGDQGREGKTQYQLQRDYKEASKLEDPIVDHTGNRSLTIGDLQTVNTASAIAIPEDQLPKLVDPAVVNGGSFDLIGLLGRVSSLVWPMIVMSD